MQQTRGATSCHACGAALLDTGALVMEMTGPVHTLPITITIDGSGASAGAGSSTTPARASRLDIVAMVFAILVPPVGVILAYVAQDELRQRGRRSSLVTAALAVGWILTAGLVAVIVIAAAF
jgi:tellurite resistance protein TehA-like permease